MENGKKASLLKRSGAWVFIPGIIFLMLIPKFYVWDAELPETDNLNKIEGKLVHRKISNRKGWKVGVEHKDEVQYFTCGHGVGASHTCYANRMRLSEHEGLEGSHATIWWYEQPIYLFAVQERLVRLDVSGRTVISREDTQEDVSRNAKKAPWWLLIYIVFCLVAGAWLISLEKRKAHE